MAQQPKLSVHGLECHHVLVIKQGSRQVRALFQSKGPEPPFPKDAPEPLNRNIPFLSPEFVNNERLTENIYCGYSHYFYDYIYDYNKGHSLPYLSLCLEFYERFYSIRHSP